MNNYSASGRTSWRKPPQPGRQEPNSKTDLGMHSSLTNKKPCEIKFLVDNAQIVYPHSTILSEHTVAVIEKNIKPQQRQLIESFVEFLWSEAAQKIFAEYGFRSMDERINVTNPNFGVISAPFTVDDLGGWPQAKREIIETIWKQRVLQEIGQ